MKHSISTPNTAAGHPDFTTFGLNNEWEQQFQWASENDVLHIWIKIIHLGQIAESPHYFKIFLQEICHPRSRQTLRDWASFSIERQQLLKLAELVESDHPLFGPLYSEKTYSERARSAFPNKSPDTHYHFLLCSAELPYGCTDEQREWYTKLRLWVFIQSLIRINPTSVVDKNLMEITKRLLYACEGNEDWQAFFNAIMFNSSGIGFNRFTNQIHIKTHSLRKADIPGFSLSEHSLDSRLKEFDDIARKKKHRHPTS